jgi:N-acetylglucosaminyldiphosphoundecaprenol N-acetyl-beta-D-mannosaminyltransferase
MNEAKLRISKRAEFLDIVIHPMTVHEFIELLCDGIRADQKWLIAHHNLHSLYLFHANPELKHYYERSQFTLADGMSLVLLARMYGNKLFRSQRVCYMDWWADMMDVAVLEKWRVFYLGSAPDVAKRGEQRLRQQFPGINLQVRHGFFDVSPGSDENRDVLKCLAEYKPNLLMVGMGMPRQELWIDANYSAIDANIILPTGATLDYIAGAIPTPPRWAGRFGLAWAFRLVSEPSRLAGRYLIEPWGVLALILLDVLGLHRGKSTGRSRPEELTHHPSITSTEP